ncbi:MAG: hypothetical protein AAF581_10385 [Planctomycetota bacterium]
MGAWDLLPWDNDGAADWFGDLFDDSELAVRVETALAADPEDAHEEIRAAAALLIMLGRTYIWPVDRIDATIRLAIDKLKQVAALEVYAESPDFVDAIAGEVAVLESRLSDESPKSNAATAVWQSWQDG